MGEKDLLRAIQTMPGVLPSNEMSNGINVRGGSADQNLFILDDMPVYNVNHLFGMLSVFNPDILKEVNFYSGNFPANFGGKLSSIVDCVSRDGSIKNNDVELSVSPLAAKITIDQPIIKNKSGLLIGVRRSYLDAVSNLILPSITDFENYNFTDVNLKCNYIINAKNKFYISAYHGVDVLRNKLIYLSSGTLSEGVDWGNNGLNVRWNKSISNNAFLNVSIAYSRYKFSSFLNQTNDSGESTKNKYLTQLNCLAYKFEMAKYFGSYSKMDVGGGFNRYTNIPGVHSTNTNPNTNVEIALYKPIEYFAFLEWNGTQKKFDAHVGCRISYFQSTSNFYSVEPRLSLAYNFKKNISANISYSRMSQPFHELTNTSINIPTNLWVPSIKEFPVEYSDIFAFRNTFTIINRNQISIGGYYKILQNIITYLPGATFMNLSQDDSKNNFPDWKENVTQGIGRAYGFELMMENNSPQFSYTLSYTLSRSIQTFDEVNFGKTFYAPFDRLHNLTANCRYHFKRKLERKNAVFINANFTYASPNPILTLRGWVGTLDPNYISSNLNDNLIYSYQRYEPVHRLDLAIQLTRLKDSKRTWEFGVYNVYNRSNPYSYYYEEKTSDAGQKEIVLKKKSLLPILPYISFQRKF